EQDTADDKRAADHSLSSENGIDRVVQDEADDDRGKSRDQKERNRNTALFVNGRRQAPKKRLPIENRPPVFPKINQRREKSAQMQEHIENQAELLFPEKLREKDQMRGTRDRKVFGDALD